MAWDVNSDDESAIVQACLTWGVSPLNASGDVANIQSALDEAAGIGKVCLGAGTFLIDSPIYLPTGTKLEMNPNTILKSTIAPILNDPTASPILAKPPVADGAATTVAAIPTIGSNTLVVNAPIDVGKVICFGNGAINIVQQATVIAIAGVGPTYTLTLDEQIWVAHQIGWDVIPYIVPTDIYVNGNGAILTGTGSNGFELAKVRRCEIKNVRITKEHGSFSYIAAAFDLGSRDTLFQDIFIDGNGVTGVCMSNECVTRGRNVRVRATGSTSQAIWLSAPWEGSIDDCTTQTTGAAQHGIQIEGYNLGLSIKGGNFFALSASGIYVNGDGVNIYGSSFLRCDRGIRVAATSGVVNIASCNFEYCGNAGIQIEGGSPNITGSSFKSGQQFDIWCTGGKTVVSGCIGDNAISGIVVGNAECIVGDSEWTLKNAGGTGVVSGYPIGPSKVKCSNVTVYGQFAGTYGFQSLVNTDVWELRNCKVPSGGTGWTGVAGSKVRFSNNDFSGATVAYAGAATSNRVTATLVAGTVVVANTLINTSDRLKLTTVLFGGTPGVISENLAARVAGTSFTLLSSNVADTSTIQCEFDG